MRSRLALSLAHATLLNLPPPQLVRVAAAAGFEFVGLRLIPIERPGEPRHALTQSPADLKATRRALADTGVRVLDVEVVQIRNGFDPRVLGPALEATAELGGRFLLANMYVTDRLRGEEAFAAVCDMARPFGLTVVLELVSFSTVTSVGRALEIVQGTHRHNAGVLIDLLHFHSSRAALGDLDRVPPGLQHFVHVCDGPADVPATADDLRCIAREGRLLPGEGGIDLARILQRLPAHVVHAVEVPNPARALALGAEAYARLAFDSTATLLDALGRARPVDDSRA
jgi:sugar phosphate isomerase/epimerase